MIEKHYTYAIMEAATQRFHIGKAKCLCEPDKHVYFGSGEWPKILKEPLGKKLETAKSSQFSKTILSIHDNAKSAVSEEKN